MKRRGRPPHPDILTPREWEVLALLRERLTNEQIGERLSISPDGAKYHVSQILQKLGVATREEAAAWQPSAVSRQLLPRLIALPIVLKGALLVLSAAVLTGLGVLALTFASSPGDGGVPPGLKKRRPRACQPRLLRTFHRPKHPLALRPNRL